MSGFILLLRCSGRSFSGSVNGVTGTGCAPFAFGCRFSGLSADLLRIVASSVSDDSL